MNTPDIDTKIPDIFSIIITIITSIMKKIPRHILKKMLSMYYVGR